MALLRRYKACPFRACLSTLIFSWICLALLTAMLPDWRVMAFLIMFVVLALPIALLADCAIDGIEDLTALGEFQLRQFRQFSLRRLFVFVTCLALFLSLLYEPWTFRLRFAMSRPELERLAARVEAGDDVEPQWAGLFFIEKADRKERDGKMFTVLWTDLGANPEGFVHPGSRNGPWFNDYSVAMRHDAQWNYFIQD